MQLVAATGTESFRLSMARSMWDPRYSELSASSLNERTMLQTRWGEPVLSDGTSIAAPNGAELVATFRQPSARSNELDHSAPSKAHMCVDVAMTLCQDRELADQM